MNIYYSPYFDSHSHLDCEARGKAMLGTLVCGNMQLLDQLELRCGIVAPQQSEQDRMVDYQHALSSVADNTIFAESFKTDEIGVSRQVMAWCDSLAMEGWTPEMTEGASEKLRSLALIAQGVLIKGAAQRWNDVYDYVREHRIFAEGDTIEACAPREAIPMVVRRVLEAVGAKFDAQTLQPMAKGDLERVQDVLLGGKAHQLQHDGSLVVHRFKHRDEAYQWYLLNDAGRDSVTISRDNCLLNDLAAAIGRPAVASTSSDSNPQVLQLFKLGLSLFARPLNVNNLLAYLRVPGHPAGGVARQLAEVLVKEGGINQVWYDTIDNYDFTDDKGRNQRAERMKFLDFITINHPNGIILAHEVCLLANNMAHWCDKLLRSDHVEPERKEQLAVLAAYCRALALSLKDKEQLTPDSLQQLVNGIYRPHSFTHYRAMQHSAETLSSVLQMVDPVARLCWLGCVGSEVADYPYSFVNATEHEWLAGQGVSLPSSADHYQLYQEMLNQALSRVTEHMTLVTWDYDGNARVEEHSVVTQLAAVFKGLGWQTDTPILPENKVDVVPLAASAAYEVGTRAQRRRERESYTSIDKLIQYPFDYAMEYLAKLREPSDAEMANLEITKGKVVHLVVEQMVNDYLQENKAFVLPADLDERINKAISQTGAILLLPENDIERNIFVNKLKESLGTLVDIITSMHLRPVGSEVDLQVELPKIGPFEAEIDLLLLDSEDHYVIFDLKWTTSNRHKESLEKNLSLQLELYRQVVKIHHKLNYSPCVGYYLFPQCELVTADSLAGHAAIQRVKVDAERSLHSLYDEILNSYEFRRDELDRGHIEESELEELSALAYTQCDQDLVPLKPDYNQKDRKGTPYVSGVKKKSNSWDKLTEPKQIATTHSILKDRLQ